MKRLITAVYFNGNKRLLTYQGIDYLTAIRQLIDLQKRDKTPITMIVVDDVDKLPVDELSMELEDFKKYVGEEK